MHNAGMPQVLLRRHNLLVSPQELRAYRAHFRGRHGGDCGCGCGPACHAYRAPASEDELERAHARALAQLLRSRG